MGGITGGGTGGGNSSGRSPLVWVASTAGLRMPSESGLRGAEHKDSISTTYTHLDIGRR